MANYSVKELRMRKKEEIKNDTATVTNDKQSCDNDDAKILRQLAQQSIILVTQFDVIEKRLDKTIEILDKLLKLKKLEMGIYE